MSQNSAQRSSTARGFTLAELMVGLSLAAILMAGILAAYLFLGRNLTRMANMQEQSVKSRRALFLFTRDVSALVAFDTASPPTSSNLTFTIPMTLTNCATTSANSTVTCASTAGMLVGMPVWSTPAQLTLTNCRTIAASTTVTCASTSGLAIGSTISGTGIPSNAVVNSITNATTFVMNVNATLSNTGITLNTTAMVKSIPDNATVSSISNATTFVISAGATVTTTGATLFTANKISYVYDSNPPATLKRTDVNNNVTTTLLTGIDTAASNGFVYYSSSGLAVSSSLSINSVEFSFTTAIGTAGSGTRVSFKTVSPRLVVRNKSLLQ